MQVAEQLTCACYFVKGGEDIVRLSESTSAFNVLRIFRLCRVFRLARLVHIVSDLQALLASIVSSLRSLCWSLVLLLLLSYMPGLALTDIVTDHRVATHFPHGEELQERFGSLTSCMLSLFESITDGIEWVDVVNPLCEDISPLLLLPFCFYISFVLFALLNVITAIFIDRSLQHGQDELREYLLEEARLAFMNQGKGEKSHMITRAEMEMRGARSPARNGRCSSYAACSSHGSSRRLAPAAGRARLTLQESVNFCSCASSTCATASESHRIASGTWTRQLCASFQQASAGGPRGPSQPMSSPRAPSSRSRSLRT